MEYKTTLVNLKILGQIDNGTKLSTRTPEFVLDEYTRFQSIIRFMHGDDRAITMIKIEHLLKNVQTIVKQLMSKDFVPDKNAEMLSYLNLDNMRVDIDKAIVGLEKLKDTYKDDKTTCAKLEIEISTLVDLRNSIPAKVVESDSKEKEE
jgi:hypothetical protein